MFAQFLAISSMASIVAAFGATISANTVMETKYPGSFISGISVNEGIFLSIFDVSMEFSSLQVDAGGGFFVTGTTGMHPNSFTNNGLVSITNTKYTEANENVIGGSMINNGRLFYSNLSGTVIYSMQTWKNSGLIVVSGPSGKNSILNMAVFEGPITNTGVICLINQKYEMSSQLTGGGCVHVVDASTFYFSTRLNPSSLDNTIVLDGSNARFIYLPCGGSYTIAGYGGGNTIEVLNQTPLAYQYDDQSGTLTITAAGHTDYFNIGSGYIASDFYLWGNNQALTYNGPVPNPPPSKCGRCPPIPIVPSSI